MDYTEKLFHWEVTPIAKILCHFIIRKYIHKYYGHSWLNFI